MVVLIEGPLEEDVVVVEEGACATDGPDFALVWEMLEDEVIFVDWRVGATPVACWMSLPCSEIRLGPSWTSFLRSCGVILERTRSLTGCLELVSE